MSLPRKYQTLLNLIREAVRLELNRLGYQERQKEIASQRWLTKQDVCAIMGVSERTLELLIADGKIRMKAVGGQLRITPEFFREDIARMFGR